jgi:hypothetical protein
MTMHNLYCWKLQINGLEMAGHINLTNILNNIYNQTTRWELQAKWQHECAA